jgi:anaerobic magnesium-protoporphyrin IX monomethyl ester cyclase
MEKKLLFGVFTQKLSIPASIFSAYAKNQKGWMPHIVGFDDTDDEVAIAEKIAAFHPNLLALTIKTFERTTAFRVAKVAKSMGVKVIAGGVHPTYVPEDLVKSGLFDAIVVGDGLGILDDLLDGYSNLEDSEIIVGKRHNNLNFYTDLFYTDEQVDVIRDLQRFDVLTTAGCMYKCTFCATDFNFHKYPIDRCAQNIIDMHAKTGFKSVSVLDDIFTMNPKRIGQLRHHLEDAGLSFSYIMNARASLFTEEVADELMALGPFEPIFGVETASPKLAKFLNKEGTAVDAYNAWKVCQKTGVPFCINLLIGLPTQDREDYELTLDFIRKTQPDNINIFHFTPFPGAGLYEYCIENDYMPDGWNFDSYLGMEKHLTDFRGYREGFGILKKVDYDLAREYKEKFEAEMYREKDALILSICDDADSKPWTIFGGGDYFYRILERMEKYKGRWHNFLGFHDYKKSFYFQKRRYFFDIPEYSWNSNDNTKPHTVVVTNHKGKGKFEDVDLPKLRGEYNFDGEIKSLGTYQY